MSTKAEHTPGPWLIAPGNFIVADCHGDDPSAGRIVAEVPCQGGNTNDLPLIAAAPDLLAALEAVIDDESHETPESWHRAYVDARAAIAKARPEGGETRG